MLYHGVEVLVNIGKRSRRDVLLTFDFLFQDIDIKKQGSNGAYAFIQYLDITHAVEAKRQMNHALSGRNRLKVREIMAWLFSIFIVT